MARGGNSKSVAAYSAPLDTRHHFLNPDEVGALVLVLTPGPLGLWGSLAADAAVSTSKMREPSLPGLSRNGVSCSFLFRSASGIPIG